MRGLLAGWWWQLSPLARTPLRRLRRVAGDTWHRLRSRPLPRVVVELWRDAPALPTRPVVAADVHDPDELAERLKGQTETAISPVGQPDTHTYLLPASTGFGDLPPTHLEALLMTAAAEDLDWVAGGWARPGDDPGRPSGDISAPTEVDPGALQLIRLPDPEKRAFRGRVVAHVTELAPSGTNDAGQSPVGSSTFGWHLAIGPYRLPPQLGQGRVVRSRATALDRVLGALPAIDGPPTVLFLLPFLAIGGAEHLLFDLVAGLEKRFRCLIVTLEPHRRALGQTVDRARELVDGVYTLGDWLPREAHPGALRHLVRRWRVAALMSWNGTVLFYDHAHSLKRAFPEIRLVHQVFNHRGSWIDRLGPRVRAAVDHHVAINGPIAEALVHEHRVDEQRVSVIHHGVEVPHADTDPESRRQVRASLGLPVDGMVVGIFVRLHPQKRPADVLAIARRLPEVTFLLAGGGPLAGRIDRALARRPLPNLVRLPFQRDVARLYDAVDLVLSTSSFEGLPVFLLEALARGVPAVATGVGDIPMLLAEGGGIVVERPGDLDALVAAIVTLLDPSTRATASRRGRETVARRFSLDRYVDGYTRALFPDHASRRESS